MKKSIRTLFTALLLSVMTLNSISVLADSTQAEEDRSGGFFKIGYGYKFDQNPYEDEQNGLALFISGRYQMDVGLFVEASYGTNKRKEGLNLGYNFYNIPNWNFDLTTVQAFGGTTIVANKNTEVLGEEGVFEKTTVRVDEDNSEMLGFRATGSFGETNLQFIVAPYLIGNDYNDALYSSLWTSQTWQVKNWEFYATAGVEYRSAAIIARYFEPNAALQSVGFPAYDASSGFDLTAQLGTSYPISENILFESYLRYTDIADSIVNSPIIRTTSQIPGRDENATELGILFSYVF